MGNAEASARFVIAVEDINGAWASLQPVSGLRPGAPKPCLMRLQMHLHKQIKHTPGQQARTAHSGRPECYGIASITLLAPAQSVRTPGEYPSAVGTACCWAMHWLGSHLRQESTAMLIRAVLVAATPGSLAAGCVVPRADAASPAAAQESVLPQQVRY